MKDLAKCFILSCVNDIIQGVRLKKVVSSIVVELWCLSTYLKCDYVVLVYWCINGNAPSVILHQ